MPHGILVGISPNERYFLSPCNGLFALEGLTFATDFPGQSSARRSVCRT
jgi:hypothetical protein